MNSPAKAFIRSVRKNFDKHKGKIIVIKAGGETWDDPVKRESMFETIYTIQVFGGQVVVAHGAGKQINEEYANRGLPKAKFEKGERMCDLSGLGAAMDATTRMTQELAEEYIRYVAKIEGGRHGFTALPVNAFDMRLVEAKAKEPYAFTGDEKSRNYTGDVARVNSRGLKEMLSGSPHVVPFINCICADIDDPRSFLNVNADFVASALAGDLNAERFMMCTTAPGIVDTRIELAEEDKDKEFTVDDPRLIRNATKEEIEHLIEIGVIAGGMIPKVLAALDALTRGVEASVILHADATEEELFTEDGAGTYIAANNNEPPPPSVKLAAA